jgi:membrane protein required for colicin V production
VETYDIIMLVVLVGTALFGAIKGFAWQLASIASIVVSYIVAFNFREPLSQSIHADPPWNRFLAMLILFIGTSLVIWVAFRMISNTIDRLRLKEFDRQIGALFGLAKGGLYCILVTLFGVTLLGETVREKIVTSRSGHYIASVLDRSEALIPEEIHEVVGPYLERFDKRFKDGEGTQDGSVLPWLRAATEASSPDSYWNSQNTAAGSPLPVDPRGWLPPPNSAPNYLPQPSGEPSGFRPPNFQQAERPYGGAF